MNGKIVNILAFGESNFDNIEEMVQTRTDELIDKMVEEIETKLRQLNELTKKSLVGFVRNEKQR